jgi:DNA-binding CsgD family transcriptional regulator
MTHQKTDLPDEITSILNTAHARLMEVISNLHPENNRVDDCRDALSRVQGLLEESIAQMWKVKLINHDVYCHGSNINHANTSKIKHKPLNERERQVLHLLAAGKKLDQISDFLKINMGSVNWHIKQIKKKFGVKTTAEVLMMHKREIE